MKIALFILLVATGAPGKPVKVDTWHDRAVRFDRHVTFDFDFRARSGRGGGGGRASFTREAEMREMIVAALEKRGYRHDTENEVDFLVTCQYTPPQASGRRGGSSRSGVSSGFSLTFGEGNDNSIYIELREPEQRLPIWRGTGKRVQVKNQGVRERLALAIETVLAAFPPAPHRPPAERESTP